MIDKRQFHYFLNQTKDNYLEYFGLLEAIQEEMETKVDPISKEEKKALKQYPIQYVKKIDLNAGEWTSQLHNWAEQCVPEIIELDPIYMAFKNSAGDTVLMSFIIGCTGAYTEKLDYHLINKLLNTDMSYEDIEKNGDDEEIIIKNAFNETDLNGQTPIDYLIDFAYGIGQFKGEPQDEKLKHLLKKFAENESKQQEEMEKSEVDDSDEIEDFESDSKSDYNSDEIEDSVQSTSDDDVDVVIEDGFLDEEKTIKKPVL